MTATAATNPAHAAELGYRWRLYGDDVLADIAGCDLPDGGSGAVRVRVEAGGVEAPVGTTVIRSAVVADGAPSIELLETAGGMLYEVEGVA